MAAHIKKLDETFGQFKALVEKRITQNTASTSEVKERISELQEELEEKTNLIHQKMEGLKENKGSILLVLNRISPHLPESFPKNFEFVLNYSDIVLTGNQKFLDFEDEGDLNQKFVIPLLDSGSTTTIKVEVWGTEQTRSLFDFAEINLESEVENALEAKKVFNQQVKLQRNSDFELSYSISLQGIGFQSWLKNLQLVRDTEDEMQFQKKQNQASLELKKQKAQEKIRSFNKKFEGRDREIPPLESYEQSCREMDSLLQLLKDS